MVRETSVAAFYERLRNAALDAPSSPVFIFPSARDTDSLCAFQILTLCLVSDSVRYSAYPVANSSDIKKLPALSLNAEEATVVLLINWGASQDLLRLLNCGPNVHIFVVDSHRPIHLQNISALNPRVVVLYTEDDEREADIHYSFRLSELADSPELGVDVDESSEEESDDDDDVEDDDDDDLDYGVRKRRRSGGDDAERSGGGVDPYWKELKRKKHEYYSKGSYHGKPSGFLMYEMSHSQRKNNNEHLWLACVSLTDQYVHERLTSERYLSGVMTLELHVTSSGNLERATSATLKDGTKVRVPDVTRIVFEDEPRLMLLREWTLFDSMLCSSYVATKLKTWTDNGLHTLKLLLANMGIPLVECQQRYQHMSSETKRNLKTMFEEKESTSGLTDLYYRSFHRYHGYSAKVSAADVVFGVTALLETWKGGPPSESSGGDQFLDAVKALKADNLTLLQEGMHMAIKVQRAIVRQGSLAIARKDVIKSSGGFRALKLEMTAETELLAHPLSLTRFCYFLMDALKEQGSRPKPMVIAAPVPGSSKYFLIVGVAHRPRLGVPYGNKFGLAFREVAETMGADFCQYAFESSWIRLDKDDVNSFMLRVAEKIRA